MLDDSLSFPRTSDDWIGTLLIGAVLTLLGVLILPAIVVQGYLVRVARATAAGDPAPSFTDWGELLVDGLRLFVLNLVVGLLVLVPLGVVLGVAGAFGGATGSRAVAGAVGLLLVGLLALVAVYFLPAAVSNFAIEDSLSAAFDVRTVADGALTSDYAMAWGLALVIGLFGGVVGSALAVVLVGFVVLFYVQVVTYYLFARGFAAGRGVGAWGVTAAGTAAWNEGVAGADVSSSGESTMTDDAGDAGDDADDATDDAGDDLDRPDEPLADDATGEEGSDGGRRGNGGEDGGR